MTSVHTIRGMQEAKDATRTTTKTADSASS